MAEPRKLSDLEPKLQNRVQQLQQQMQKVEARIEAEPDHPKMGGWKRSWEECRQGLENIARHGRETIVDNPVGVAIDVPVKRFNVEG